MDNIKVKMELTSADVVNARKVRNAIGVETKADAISFALAFTRTMLDKVDEDTRLYLKNEKSGLQTRVYLKTDAKTEKA